MIGVLFFLFGLIFGSFLNAVIWRLPRQKEVVLDRSECVACGHKLGFYDLLPVVSFLWLRGRCRYCGERISFQYPVVEIISGLGLLAISFLDLNIAEKIWLSGMFLLSVLIFAYDLKYFLIPDRFVIMGLVWVLAGAVVFTNGDFLQHLASGFLVFLFFFLLYFFSKGRWIGGGDPKLGFVIGLWLGWPLGVLAILLAYVVGAAISLVLLAFRSVTMKSRVPFGPFILAGAWGAYFWGGLIIEWYMGLFI